MIGNLVGGLAFTGLTLYATHVRTAPKRGRRVDRTASSRPERAIEGLPEDEAPFRGDTNAARTENIGRAVFRQGPQGNQSGFSRRPDPRRAAAEPEGYRHRAGRRHQQQQCQPDRQRVGGQGLPDRLLLHLGILVGEDLGTARAGRDQFLAAFADAAQPVSLRQGQRLCLHAERHGHQVHHRACVSCRRFPRSTALSGNTLEQLTNDHRVIISSEQSYLGRALGVNPQIEIDYQRCRSSRATCSCWRPTASTSMSAARHIAQRINDGADDLDEAAKADRRAGLSSAAARTISPSRSSASTSCRTARRASCSAQPSRIAAAAAAGSADGVRRLPDRPRVARHEPQPHLPRRRHRDRRRSSPSRSRRSICATIRPI